MLLNPIALRKAKIVYNFGLSKCSRVKVYRYTDMFFFVVFFFTKGENFVTPVLLSWVTKLFQ